MCTKEERWKVEDGIRPKEQKILMTGKIKEIRELMVEEQDGRCAICDCVLDKVHCDHGHKKHGWPGFVRGALCPACNQKEGRLSAGRYRRMNPEELYDWLVGAAKYVRDNIDNPKNILHPKERSFTKHPKKQT